MKVFVLKNYHLIVFVFVCFLFCFALFYFATHSLTVCINISLFSLLIENKKYHTSQHVFLCKERKKNKTKQKTTTIRKIHTCINTIRMIQCMIICIYVCVLKREEKIVSCLKQTKQLVGQYLNFLEFFFFVFRFVKGFTLSSHHYYERVY